MLGFNGDQIVTANVTTDPKRRLDITDVTVGQEVIKTIIDYLCLDYFIQYKPFDS